MPLGLSAAAAATPTAGHGPVTITFLPWGGWPAYAGPHWQAFIQPGIDHFQAMHPGIRVRVGPPAGGNTSVISAILAGQGPDVFQDWVLAPYEEAGLAMNLLPYIRRDNIPLSTWSPGQLHTMQTQSGIWALPTYVHVDAIAVNLSSLDELGLKYPDPDWDYQAAEKIFRACTYQKNGKQHYGLFANFPGTHLDEHVYPCHLWGGSVRDASRTKCIIDQSNAYLGIQWYLQLYWDNVIGGPGNYTFTFDQQSFREIGSNSVIAQLAHWRDNFKWTYMPPPMFPAGRATFEADDAFLINAQTKYPEESWELMKFLTAEPYWQRYNMKYLLRTPGMVALWDEWVSYVEAAAPVARGRNLSVFKEAAAKWGVANRYFKYDDTVVEPILSNALATAYARKQDLATALHLAAEQVNAHEAAAAALAGKAASELGALNAAIAAAKGAQAKSWSAPAVTGIGMPPTAATSAVTVKDGVYTLLGSGGGIGQWGKPDGLTFDCLPWSATQGTFTCRLTAIQPVGTSSLPNGAKVGLMVRGDLSTLGTFAAVYIAVGRGLHAESRVIAATNNVDQRAGTAPGLLAAAGLVQNGGTNAAQYLLKPVWLRLVQDYNIWTAYTSLDGATWLAAGKPMALETEGVWVGLFATPHDTTAAHHLRATFDHVSFTPSRAYQIG